jgi:hypothetical protein
VKAQAHRMVKHIADAAAGCRKHRTACLGNAGVTGKATDLCNILLTNSGSSGSVYIVAKKSKSEVPDDKGGPEPFPSMNRRL